MPPVQDATKDEAIILEIDTEMSVGGRRIVTTDTAADDTLPI
jgi:hypothetical protein